MFKAASIVEFIFEAGILIVCGLVWAMAGFPHFTEVATVGGLAIVVLGVYLAVIWNRK